MLRVAQPGCLHRTVPCPHLVKGRPRARVGSPVFFEDEPGGDSPHSISDLPFRFASSLSLKTINFSQKIFKNLRAL